MVNSTLWCSSWTVVAEGEHGVTSGVGGVEPTKAREVLNRVEVELTGAEKVLAGIEVDLAGVGGDP